MGYTKDDGSFGEDHLPNLSVSETERYYADKLQAKAVKFAPAESAEAARSWQYDINADNVRVVEVLGVFPLPAPTIPGRAGLPARRAVQRLAATHMLCSLHVPCVPLFAAAVAWLVH